MSIIKLLIVGAAVLGLGACTLPAQVPTPEKPASSSSSPYTPPPKSDNDMVAPVKFEVGQPVTVSADGKPIGTITVNSVRHMTKAEQPYVQGPKKGYYWVVSVTYQAQADGFKSNMFDWKVKDDKGLHYDMTMMVTDDPMLTPETLSAGDKSSGSISWDAPVNGLTLVYTPAGSTKPVAVLAMV